MKKKKTMLHVYIHMQTPALDNQLVFCPSVDNNNNIFLAVQPSRYQKKKKYTGQQN